MGGIDNLPVTGGDAFDPSSDEMTMKRIGVRQTFPAAAKREARRVVARRQVDEARARAQAERRIVQRAVADAWIDAWAAQHEAHAIGNLHEQALLAAKLARARLAGGAGSVAETLAADAAVLELENREEEADAKSEAALANLRRWVPSATGVAVSDAPNFDSQPVQREQLLTRIDQLVPLLGATARVETAAAAIDESRAEKRLDWSVSASYGQRDRDRSDMLSVEVEVPLPLFASSRQDRGTLAREAEYREAVALRDDERRALIAEVNAAFIRYESLKRQVALHEERLLPLAHDRSAAALAAYRAGGDLQPWLEARAAQLDVDRSHAEHLGELGHAWAALALLLPEDAP